MFFLSMMTRYSETRRARNDVCIVAISGKNLDERVNFLKMAELIGADFVLPKPIDAQQLAGILGGIRNRP
jgi:hypothetical protein